MSYKKQRPLTATFPAAKHKTWTICNSEIAPQTKQRPKTALSRHIVDELDKKLGTKDAIPLKKYERLNDPAMDPVVVKAVKSFAKQRKIVTHETIIDIGERVAKAKEVKHRQILGEAIQKAVEEERARLQEEFKMTSEKEHEELKSDWIEKIDNTDQIAADAAKAAADEVRQEMNEKISLLEEVHTRVVESTVKERLAKSREEWKKEEKENIRLVRIKCDKEYEAKLKGVVEEKIREKHEEWCSEEEKKIVSLSEELKVFYEDEIEQMRREHEDEMNRQCVTIAGLESQVEEMEMQVVDERHEHDKTRAALQDTRFHFSRFIGEVPGFESDYFQSSPFPEGDREDTRDVV